MGGLVASVPELAAAARSLGSLSAGVSYSFEQFLSASFPIGHHLVEAFSEKRAKAQLPALQVQERCTHILALAGAIPMAIPR